MTDRLSEDLRSLRIDRAAPGGVPVVSSGGAPGGRSRLASLGVGLVVAGLLGGAGFGLRAWAGDRPLGLAALAPGLARTQVSTTNVTLVSSSQANTTLTASGYVVPQHVARVGPRIGGRVKSVSVREWDRVKAGQVLFTLDAADQLSTLTAAHARARAANAKVEVARSQLLETERQLERERALVESGAVASSNFDDMKTRARTLRAQIGAAEAEAATVGAESVTHKVRLHDLTIVAPIDGVASSKPAAVGDVVDTTQTLVTLVDMSSLVLEVDVAEARLGLVKVGTPCEIVLDAFPDVRHRGEVAELSPLLDRSKGTLIVKVRFSNVPPEARGQMAARVNFLSQPTDPEELRKPPRRVVPSSALVERDGGKFVFVLEEGKARLTRVALGPAAPGGFELLEGPSAGARLVQNPPGELTDGASVKEKSGGG